MYQDRDTTANVSQPPITVDAKIPQKAWGAELQHIFRSNSLSLRSGIGYFDVDRTDDILAIIDLPPPPDGPGTIENQSVTDAGTKHFNAYVYANVALSMNLTAILGASYDSVKSELPGSDKNQFNPKLGLIWNATPATTVRAAAFKVLKRTLITDQTLEPTEVAGFNQFFDDVNFTESWRYGAAIDQKFGSNVLAGLEYSQRDLTVPWTDIFCETCDPPQQREADWEEALARAYLFWTPHPWWALTAEYVFEQYKRDPSFAAGARDLDSTRVPLGVRFFHPSGFSASLTGTYWKQKGEFGDPEFQSGSEKFWVIDAAISYRLPKRYGLITVGASNLFDKQFRFFDVDESNPTIQPQRMVFARFSLAFP
jgi:outer membrane receptor protein involved in Fe transport